MKKFNFKLFIYFFVSTISAFLLATCTFTENEFAANPPFDPESPCLCYPIGIGFEWTYKDSSQFVNELRKVKVLSNHKDSLGRIIWNLENNSLATGFFLGKQIYLKNDSLYIIDMIPFYINLTRPYLRLVPPQSNEFLLRISHQDIGMQFRIIYHKNKPIKVGNFVFNHWISYSKVTVSKDIDSTIVVPEIGIVYKYLEYNLQSGAKSISKSELVEFKRY